MTKKELVQAVAEIAEVSQKDTESVLEGFVDLVYNEAQAGREVAYPGLGKFTVAERAERMGRNPQTGDTVKIAASKTVRFKASSKLKEAVNA